MLDRKGARRRSEVPADVLAALHRGELETANLVELLAMDQQKLAVAVLPSVGMAASLSAIELVSASGQPLSAVQATRAIASVLALQVSFPASERSAYVRLREHSSDVVRCWAAMILQYAENLTLAERLEEIRPYASDSHFGVREMAWMAVRGAIAAELELAFDLLAPWSRDEDANIRRFASEVTRPRGVWCKHIESLKVDPSPALPLLEPLRSDDSKYVRDSVANWLNDAGKTRQDWVKQLVARWQKESPTSETAYIARRALRSMSEK